MGVKRSERRPPSVVYLVVAALGVGLVVQSITDGPGGIVGYLLTVALVLVCVLQLARFRTAFKRERAAQ